MPKTKKKAKKVIKKRAKAKKTSAGAKPKTLTPQQIEAIKKLIKEIEAI